MQEELYICDLTISLLFGIYMQMSIYIYSTRIAKGKGVEILKFELEYLLKEKPLSRRNGHGKVWCETEKT